MFKFAQVDFRNNPYTEANPFDISKDSWTRVKFPKEHVYVAPDTYLHALCYTNIWDTGLSLFHQLHEEDRILLQNFPITPHTVERAEGEIGFPWQTLGDFDETRAIFEDLLKHEEIERALAIPDLHGHTALEILVREAGADAPKLISTLEPVAHHAIGHAKREGRESNIYHMFNQMLRVSVGAGPFGLPEFPPEPVFKQLFSCRKGRSIRLECQHTKYGTKLQRDLSIKVEHNFDIFQILQINPLLIQKIQYTE